MTMKINQYLIRVKASAIPITQELKMGEELSAIIMGTVTKIEDTDNDNGSIDRTYHITGQFAECINREKQPITRGETEQIYR